MFSTKFSFRFDGRRILTAADRAEQIIANKFGAYVRTTARRSIKRAKTATARSRPGQPPLGHGNELYRNFIKFAYSRENHSVVIGSELLVGTMGDIAPEKIEYGGAERITVGKPGNRHKIMGHYLPRPAMRMAFHTAINRFLPQLIAGSVR